MKTKILNKIAIVTFVLPMIFGTFGDALAQLNYVPTTSNTSQTTSAGCLSLKYNLFLGQRGLNGDVARYQSFLINSGYLSPGLATGYFGSLSLSATKRFQAANGIPSTGYVGPLTRARISALTCNVVPPIDTTLTPVITSISPSYGPFGTVVTIYGRNFNSTSNSVNFGNVNNIAYNIPSYDGTSLRFTIPSSPCAQGSSYCIQIAFAPGQYPLSVTTPKGTSNSVTFTATSGGTSTDRPPVISAIVGPTNLSTGQQGTWTVAASDPYNGQLSYSVVWGDEGTTATSAASPTQTYSQSTSFTHVYANPGTYTPTVTVRNSTGLSAVTSTSVLVTGSVVNNAYPVITSITPTSGPAGTLFTIKGTGFSSSTKILFDGGVNSSIPVASFTDTTITFNVPAYVPSNCYDYSGNCIVPSVSPTPVYSTVGNHQISLANSNSRISNMVYITITNQSTQVPTITNISPMSGPSGTVVTITGSNFSTSSNSINFANINNVQTNVVSQNNQTIQFTIPATPCSQGYYCAQTVLALGTYPLTVTTSAGTSNTVYFTVTGAVVNASSTITLALGQTGTSSTTISSTNGTTYTLSITPNSIVEDSRCAVGLYCFQAGRVVVNSTFRVNNAYVYGGNLIAENGDTYVTPEGFRIQIIDVTPVKTQSPISTGDYRLTYKVSR